MVDHCYFSIIRFAIWVWQDSELLIYFYLTSFPTAKNEFQNWFETRSRYSHTPPETTVVVNRERINNVLRSIYVGCLLESWHYHQPINWCRKKQKLFSPKGLVKISAIFSVISMDLMVIVPSLTNRRKWWYLMAMCFFRGVNFGIFVTVMQISLSSHTVQRNTGSLVNSPNNPAVAFMRPRNGITSHISLDRAMYSLSVLLRGISVLNLLPQVIGNPAYTMTKPVRDNTDSGMLWLPYFHPPAKSASM